MMREQARPAVTILCIFGILLCFAGLWLAAVRHNEEGNQAAEERLAGQVDGADIAIPPFSFSLSVGQFFFDCDGSMLVMRLSGSEVLLICERADAVEGQR